MIGIFDSVREQPLFVLIKMFQHENTFKLCVLRVPRNLNTIFEERVEKRLKV